MNEEDRDGVEAERLVKRMLQCEGWRCLPAKYQRLNEDSAEIIEGENDAVRNPDIFTMGHGEALFVEVKQFNSPVYTRARGQGEHGIRQPKFDDYKAVSDTSGIPLWIFILESGPGRVIASKVSDLPELDPISPQRCREEYGELLTYFPRTQMQEVSLKDDHVPDSFPIHLKTGQGQPLNDVLNGVEADRRVVNGGKQKTSIDDFI
jgi:hypothetical protein